ncbi:MAG: cysteine protease [Fibrobacter sp.]|nr:cysteine protease [Fibrobacter sp.]
MSTQNTFSFGWERDLPDIRDLHESHKEISPIISKSSKLKAAKKALPASVDLRSKCSPIKNQGELGSCTAHAGVGLMEYYQRNAFRKHIDGSRRFLYKATRNLLGWTGDDGAYLRTTMKAMVLFGICPEQYWVYDIEKFNEEPSAFCYAFAQNYQAMKYYRLDPSGTTTGKLLQSVKEKIAAQLPSMFGFSVYNSISFDPGFPDIPFPEGGDQLIGGHAVVAVGYDDKRKIGKETGALLIRNSWGKEWGDKGYGWLPYEYVRSGLAVDFWSLIEAEFVASALFE